MRLAGATAGSSAAAASPMASNERAAAATSSARTARSTSGRGDDKRSIVGLLTQPVGDGGRRLLGGEAEIARGQGADELHHPFYLLPVERDHSPVARQPHPRGVADRATGEKADFERQVSVRVPPERDRM